MAGPSMKYPSTMGKDDSEYKSNDPRIPQGLRYAEGLVYQDLLQVAKQRKAAGVPPPQVVVITDIMKDVDDLVAMVLLKDLHRLGLIVLKGFVANLKPARTRALAAKGALNTLGLSDIPVGVGTDAQVVEVGKQPRKVSDYEFDMCPFIAPSNTHLEDGFDLLTKLCKDAKRTGKKLTFLLISGLRDINNFAKAHPDLLAATAEKFVLQGGYRVEEKGGIQDLVAAEDAANNTFDIVAAREFHHYMAKRAIPSTSFTKLAAFATDIPEQLMIDLEESGHPVGKYLRKAQVLMDVDFYKSSCSPDPTKRFRPFMDQEWYLKNKSSYYQTPHPKGEPLPVGDEVIKYFNKLVAYDALAALAAGGDDVLKQLSISRPTHGKKLHQVMGVAEVTGAQADPKKGIKAQAADTGINGKPMAQAIRALGCLFVTAIDVGGLATDGGV
ncbi:hypothetical protein LAWI1_G006499 [Lachnellula willkommii]|uniref:Inosine/uridine-preferring nucleoside hydrolase domain-containing protein n=1 Tax=Lachnellula willkommii TaxID=215461 RepID=A0A559M2B6_9HELO|nr:hypothetical protein LAWI1_G006499 [Lachnellula willkommii]